MLTGGRVRFYFSPLVLLMMALLLASFYWNFLGPYWAGRAPTTSDFYNELWAPTHLLTQGQSPYKTASLYPHLPAVWFPMAVGFFFPLGLLSDELAAKIWLMINVLELFALIMLSIRSLDSNGAVLVLGGLVYFFPVVFSHLLLGQFSLTTALCLLASAVLAEKRHDWLAAFCLALGLSKPQLGIMAVLGLGVFYYRAGGFKLLVRFGVQTGFMVLLTSLPLFIAYPGWIPDWISSEQSNRYMWTFPSLFSALQRFMGAPGYLIWGIILIAGCVLCYQLWTHDPPRLAMPWTLGITVMVSTYVWSWDFVLLIPVWAYIFSHSSWRGQAFLVLTYLLGWVGFAYVQSLPNSNNSMFWWFPLWLLACVSIVSPPIRLWRTSNSPPG